MDTLQEGCMDVPKVGYPIVRTASQEYTLKQNTLSAQHRFPLQ